MARARFCKGSERPFAARARVLGRISLPPGHIRPRLLVMAQDEGNMLRCPLCRELVHSEQVRTLIANEIAQGDLYTSSIGYEYAASSAIFDVTFVLPLIRFRICVWSARSWSPFGSCVWS